MSVAFASVALSLNTQTNSTLSALAGAKLARMKG